MAANSLSMKTFLVVLALTIPFLMPAAGRVGVDVIASPEVQKLLDQVNRVYLEPKGLSMEKAFNHDVISAGTYMGLGLMGQQPYVDRNPTYAKQFNHLKGSALAYLKEVARAHGGISPKDGSPIDLVKLEKYYHAAINGGYNKWVIENYGFNPSERKQPFILADKFVEPQKGGASNRFLETKDDSDTLTLLGHPVAGAQVEKQQPSRPPIEPTVEHQAADRQVVSFQDNIPEGVLAGIWVARKKGVSITFRKQGGDYVATYVLDRGGRDGANQIVRTYTGREGGFREANLPYYTANRSYNVRYTNRCEPHHASLPACMDPEEENILDVQWDDKRQRYFFYGGIGLDISDYFDKQ